VKLWDVTGQCLKTLQESILAESGLLLLVLKEILWLVGVKTASETMGYQDRAMPEGVAGHNDVVWCVTFSPDGLSSQWR